MQRIYLDNASTTKLDERVLDAMIPYLKEDYGNASSIHSYGKTAKVLLEDTRDNVAEFIGASPKEIFFTNSGTESNNFALKGIAYKFLNSKKNHIISTSIEHMAVLDTLRYLENKFNFEVTYIRPDSKGSISLDEIVSNISDKTFLISVMHSNNETGNLNNLNKIMEVVKDKDMYVHTDSVQSIGKTEFDVKKIGMNTATLSAHKIFGPKGIAALYIREKTPVEKFIHGGMQERDMRGGTENISAIAGFKKAVELLKNNMEHDVKLYENLNDYLRNRFHESFGDAVRYNSDKENALSNIVNISFDRNKLIFDEEMILIQLDLKGIAVSGGSACTSGTHQPSHVLTEMGRDKLTALGSLRISFGRDNRNEEIDYFIECLQNIVKKK